MSPMKNKLQISFERFLQNTQEELEKKNGQFFQVVIYFHPSYSQLKLMKTRVIVNNSEQLF